MYSKVTKRVPQVAQQWAIPSQVTQSAAIEIAQCGQRQIAWLVLFVLMG